MLSCSSELLALMPTRDCQCRPCWRRRQWFRAHGSRPDSPFPTPAHLACRSELAGCLGGSTLPLARSDLEWACAAVLGRSCRDGTASSAALCAWIRCEPGPAARSCPVQTGSASPVGFYEEANLTIKRSTSL